MLGQKLDTSAESSGSDRIEDVQDNDFVLATILGQDRCLAICLAIGRLFALQPTSTAVWLVGGGAP